MRPTAIIIKNNQILLIHRHKNGKEYYVFPGGYVEKGESIENALVREVKEETNLDVKIDEILWKHEHNFNNESRMYYFFLVTDFSGKLKLSGPEAQRNNENNKYILEWHDLDRISNLLIYSEPIKEKIIKAFVKSSKN